MCKCVHSMINLSITRQTGRRQNGVRSRRRRDHAYRAAEDRVSRGTVVQILLSSTEVGLTL